MQISKVWAKIIMRMAKGWDENVKKKLNKIINKNIVCITEFSLLKY